MYAKFGSSTLLAAAWAALPSHEHYTLWADGTLLARPVPERLAIHTAAIVRLVVDPPLLPSYRLVINGRKRASRLGKGRELRGLSVWLLLRNHDVSCVRPET
jgi:hypothetical protein